MKPSERIQAVDFLRRYVMGKTVLADPVITQTDQERIVAAYEDQTFYSNFREAADGFSFDLTAVSRGTRYVPDGKGKAILAEGTLNAVRVYRYEMTERKSSGRLLGFARYVSSTPAEHDPFAGTVFLVRMSVENGTLVVRETQAGYSDFVTADGTFTPVASDGTYRYSVERDTLVVQYQQTTHDVDPETFERRPTADKFPVQISKELPFPQPLETSV